METKIIIVSDQSINADLFHVMFEDVIREKNALFLSDYYKSRGKVIDSLTHFLYRQKVNAFFKFSFEKTLEVPYILENVLENCKDQKITVIFLSCCFQRFYSEEKLIGWKHKYSKVRYVMYFLDTVSMPQAKRAYQLSQSGLFDLTYTFDKQDAAAYQFIYCPNPYSYYKADENVSMKSDSLSPRVYFCGWEKGRKQRLVEAARRFIQLNVPYEFKVFSGNEMQVEDRLFEIKTAGLMKYTDILREVENCNVLLDIVQDKQAGLSIRVLEAIVYNKVLITNNEAILELPQYNPEYMHYVEDMKDIQLEWLQERLIDYQYQGEFSPIHLLEDIEHRLEQ